MITEKPRIIEETSDFAVVYKPPKTHSTQSKHDDKSNCLTVWFADNRFANNDLPDFGLIHRLDFETHGLVLFAKNKNSYIFFKELQDKGEFIKEYSAFCRIPKPFDTEQIPVQSSSVLSDGFPPPPAFDAGDINPSPERPRIIMSFFRPYGPGRKLVRPVTEEKKHYKTVKDNGGFYLTEITNASKPNEHDTAFTLRIRRGFRHQIRCHLCWIGFPILNDPLYGSNSEPDKHLALRAHALFFTDPLNGEKKECRIERIFSPNNS